MFLTELFASTSFIYHALKNCRYAALAIQKNELLATSTQRFWDTGERLKDNDPRYENSYWMKGVSVTRDYHYAFSWGEVVFVLDKNIISQKYKIIPFNWGYSIPSGNHHKREREEFIIVKNTKDTYMDTEDDVTFFNTNRFMGPEGSIKNLSSFLRGIYVSNWKKDNHKDENTEYELLVTHPKFLGFYDSDQSINKLRKSYPRTK